MDLNLYQAKSSDISFGMGGGGGGTVAQNAPKHILVWEFLKSNEFFEIFKKWPQATIVSTDTAVRR